MVEFRKAFPCILASISRDWPRGLNHTFPEFPHLLLVLPCCWQRRKGLIRPQVRPGPGPSRRQQRAFFPWAAECASVVRPARHFRCFAALVLCSAPSAVLMWLCCTVRSARSGTYPEPVNRRAKAQGGVRIPAEALGPQAPPRHSTGSLTGCLPSPWTLRTQRQKRSARLLLAAPLRYVQINANVVAGRLCFGRDAPI